MTKTRFEIIKRIVEQNKKDKVCSIFNGVFNYEGYTCVMCKYYLICFSEELTEEQKNEVGVIDDRDLSRFFYSDASVDVYIPSVKEIKEKKKESDKNKISLECSDNTVAVVNAKYLLDILSILGDCYCSTKGKNQNLFFEPVEGREKGRAVLCPIRVD